MPCRSRGDDGRGDLAESLEPEGSDAPKVAQIETPRPPDPIVRRPRADREEKRVTHGIGSGYEEQLDPDNPNQRSFLELPLSPVLWPPAGQSSAALRFVASAARCLSPMFLLGTPKGSNGTRRQTLSH